MTILNADIYTNSTVSPWGQGTMPRVEKESPNTKAVTTKEYDESGNVKRTVEEIFDSNGNKLSHKSYNKDGELTWYTCSKYNELNQEVEYYDDLDGDGYIDDLSYFEYWENGSLKSQLVDEYGNGSIDREFHCDIEYTEEELKQQAQEKRAEERASWGWFGWLYDILFPEK